MVFDPIPSVVQGANRFRVVFKSIYPRPRSETFHEFLIYFLQWTLGREWWLSQARIQEPHRHIVLSWWDAFVAKVSGPGSPANADETVRQADSDGPVWAILSLAWDVFSLATKGLLPPMLIDRLRSKEQFQGARFELCAAGVLFRGGFDIRFLEDNEEVSKHCEFIATDAATGTEIGVEAKSRRRPGSYHEAGDFELRRDARGLEAFIRAASRQKPEGLPFVIFVDINLPSSPDVGPLEKPWLRDAQSALGLIGEPSAAKPDAFNAILLTNYCYHWGMPGEPTPRGEFGVVVSGVPMNRVDETVLRRLFAAVEKYGAIPTEV
jgi:hypothetical protein